MRNFYQSVIQVFLFGLFFITSEDLLFSQTRTEINFPDLPGYQTLKCDFHMHTVFSDGIVWPTTRVEEAWREGLDAIAITDHVEYRPHEKDIPVQYNRAYDLALPLAQELGIILIKGAEITRSMPPGHLNALFIQDDSLLNTDKAMDAIAEAARQNAYIFWNHPGWRGQQSDGQARWYDEHTFILEKGWLKGIEVVNYDEYYPEVFRWALDKNLAILSNSDIHNLSAFEYDPLKGQKRPFTLVFARERSESGIRAALEQGRTAAFFNDRIMGRKDFLQPLFQAMIQIKTSEILLNSSGGCTIQLHNHSDLDLKLQLRNKNNPHNVPADLTLYAHKTHSVKIGKLAGITNVLTPISLPYQVENMLVAPDMPLTVELDFKVLSLQAISVQPIKKVGTGNTFKFLDSGPLDGIQLFYSMAEKPSSRELISIEQPFTADSLVTVFFHAVKNGQSLIENAVRTYQLHTGLGRAVTLENSPNPKYPGIGRSPLTDGLFGSLDYHDPNWLGFEGNNLLAILDLGQTQEIKSIVIHFLQDIKSWIFLPEQVTIAVSKDGARYEEITSQKFQPMPEAKKYIEVVRVGFAPQKVRYVKIAARNVGTCPEWHSGAGGKAWLFADEIILR